MRRVDTEGTLGTVARRSEVLRALDGTVLSKPQLEEQLCISRSTIDRAARELEAAALIQRTDGGFIATTTGRLAIKEYEQLTGNLDCIEEAARLLEHIPFSDAPTPAALEDAEFRWPEQPEPARILEPILDILERADTLRAFSRTMSDTRLLSDIQQQVVEGGLDVEFVYSEPMIAHLRSAYAERMTTIRSQENFRMFMAGTLPFGLGVVHGEEMDPRLIVIAYGDDGELQGVLYNDTPASIAWGENTFQRYRREATEL